MKRKVYIETSVISYLTARISRDLIVAGHQRLTQEWWATRREAFDVSVSQVVFGEPVRVMQKPHENVWPSWAPFHCSNSVRTPWLWRKT
jgi:hypothetical protein